MPQKFLISGAGLIGLLLAQAFKSRGIEFEIFDRDESIQFREESGWAITLHWALKTFQNLLPDELKEQIYSAQVRPDFHKQDTGNFRYINAGTGEFVVSIPPSARLRVRREQIRKILLQGIDVNWNCKTEKIDFDEGVKVYCSGGKGTTFTGDVLIGCEGANSITRRLLFPNGGGELYQLPIRFCGAKVKMSESEMNTLAKNFDPLLFQGTVPGTNTFFWFSVLSCPDYTGEEGTYYGQVNLSWNVPQDEDEPFTTTKEKAAAMKKHSKDLCPELSYLVDRAVEDYNSIVEIKLCDWDAVQWDTHGGKVLLAGDSAHAMTMYRGEAANHGITDVGELIKIIDSYYSKENEKTWEEATTFYCKGIKERAAPAVLLSRQACIDAHDFSKITPHSTSPLLAIRKKT
ncbi:hypothetical protein CAAN1_11S03620 [[Candida] anglica]|uniref:FAD-binding domain-containing protein n=1 Tax=[Candida] anglica TaxID=148631 RepID=A0ABP0EHW8_9ASCO